MRHNKISHWHSHQGWARVPCTPFQTEFRIVQKCKTPSAYDSTYVQTWLDKTRWPWSACVILMKVPISKQRTECTSESDSMTSVTDFTPQSTARSWRCAWIAAGISCTARILSVMQKGELAIFTRARHQVRYEGRKAPLS
jgi:hypothetical protein